MRSMSLEFAQRFVERQYENLEEAIDYLGTNQVLDDLVDLRKIQFSGLSVIGFQNKEYRLTRSAFVQLLGLVDLTWKEVKEEDPDQVIKELRSRLHHRGGEVMLRRQSGAVQAVLSPRYTPITNLGILKAVKQSLDLSKSKITVYRGNMRWKGCAFKSISSPACVFKRGCNWSRRRKLSLCAQGMGSRRAYEASSKCWSSNDI